MFNVIIDTILELLFFFGGSFWDPIFDKEGPRAALTSCRLPPLPSIPFLFLKEVKPKSHSFAGGLFAQNLELTAP